MIVLTPASIRYGGHRRHRNGRPIRAPPPSRRVSTRMYVPSSTVLVEGGGVGDRNGYGSSRGSTVRSGSVPGAPPILGSWDGDAPETMGLADDVASGRPGRTVPARPRGQRPRRPPRW